MEPNAFVLFVGVPNEKGFCAVPEATGVEELPKLKGAVVFPAFVAVVDPKFNPVEFPEFCCPKRPELLLFVAPCPNKEPTLLLDVVPKGFTVPVLLACPNPLAGLAPNEKGFAPALLLLLLLLPKLLTAGAEPNIPVPLLCPPNGFPFPVPKAVFVVAVLFEPNGVWAAPLPVPKILPLVLFWDPIALDVVFAFPNMPLVCGCPNELMAFPELPNMVGCAFVP